MKKVFLSLILVLMFAVISFAVTEEELLEQTPVQLKAKVQEMLAAGIKSEDALNMVKNMLQQRVQTRYAAKVIDAILEAKKQGLPVGPMVSKVNEGLAKNVSTEKIYEALNQVRNRYAYAYQKVERMKLNAQMRARVAQNIVDAMAAGMKKEHMDDMIKALEQKMDRVKEKENYALEVTEMAKEMARHGVSSDEAKDVINNAMKHEFTAREMKEMREAFMEQARMGDPKDIAEQMSENMEHGARGADVGHDAGSAGSTGMDASSSGGMGTDGAGDHGGGHGRF
ncbi:hypothetical protein FHQ18_05255 [Deferribacter autotrophicus]|uniref:Uncharacterized protein n=1 Tax=Deferribacter autotrophicus TaxID=500465 RepID=A0A5A8F3H5_9BACT|nr:hypothetical protein [Deferribacter autotrophicus]KAA0258567.1 hypothetical protein FHQ18_05255 [Deferribacter autotrophicus]